MHEADNKAGIPWHPLFIMRPFHLIQQLPDLCHGETLLLDQ
jgi:hypothetical protein